VAEATEEPIEERSGRPNRTLLYIMGTLAAMFLIGGLIVGKKEEPKPGQPPAPPNARAVVVPTDDAARTIVVSPCQTNVSETAREAEEQTSTPNTVRVELPRGSGDRAVFVPHCSPNTGGVGSGRPSAAFILPMGSKSKTLQMPPLNAESQLLVQADSEARTLVIPPCTGQIGGEAGRPAPAVEGGREQDVVLEPEDPGSELAVAPQC
jgi:hypothetical protein